MARTDLSDQNRRAARLLFRYATATARDDDRRVRKTWCACGCRGKVLIRNKRLTHHFLNREHWLRWKRARQYPDDAPPGSVKHEILDALRTAIAECGATKVERIGGFPRNTINKYARGDWTYLAPKTVGYFRRVVPHAVDPADPRLRELMDTPKVREEMGRRVGAVNAERWTNRRRRARLIREHSRKLRGRPNPGVAAAKRAEWDAANPDRATKEEAFLEAARRRAHLPAEQIRRAWKSMVGRYIRQGRAPTDEDARRCAARQAADLGLAREIVLDYINRERGVLDRPGPLPDVDLLCMVRDIQREMPEVGWIAWAAETNIRLGRAMDPDTVKREYNRLTEHLGPQPRAESPKGGYPWTDEEDAYLRAHMNLPDSALARHLGRNPKAIRLRRRALGLRKRISAS